MSAKHVMMGLIRCDGGTQMRAELSSEVFMGYRDKILAGVEFPPLDVFFDGSQYWLADGFHRFYGHREAKKTSVLCNVHNGTVRDAILFAAGANDTHGIPRKNADKRNAVLALLNDEEWVKWSDGKIAEVSAVHVATVGRIRSELSQSESSQAAKTKNDPKTGRDGKKRKPRTQKPREQKPRKAKAQKSQSSGEQSSSESARYSLDDARVQIDDAIGDALLKLAKEQWSELGKWLVSRGEALAAN